MQGSRDGLACFLTEHAGDCPVGGLVHFYVPNVDDMTSTPNSKAAEYQSTRRPTKAFRASAI